MSLSPETQHEVSESACALRSDRLADSVLLLLGMTVLQRMIGFGRGIFFCRWLEPDQLGVWNLSFGFLLLAAPLAVLGVPGSFGRYVEYYRQQGQLRLFLRRTTLWTVLFSTLALIVLLSSVTTFSELIFGRDDMGTFVVALAVVVGIVIWHHFLESLFTALRQYRVVSAMHFTHSLLFAVLGLAMIACLPWGAMNVVFAYGIASLLSACGVLFWSRRNWSQIPPDTSRVPLRSFWLKLAPFIVWMWVMNLVTNLFSLADRMMIVHFGNFDSEGALVQLGNYHSALVVPMLLVGVACLLSSMITPHLSFDWEAGRKDDVSLRLNTALKLTALGLMCAGLMILLFAPTLFGVLLSGKYEGGLHVLPWTIVFCIWMGMTSIAANYLLCAEKAKLCSLALVVGLLGNIGLNVILLPLYGLWGAVLATTAANGIALALTIYFSSCAGMRVQLGTVILCIAPLAIGIDLWMASMVFVCLLLEICATDRIITRSEKEELFVLLQGYFQRAGSLLGRKQGAADYWQEPTS